MFIEGESMIDSMLRLLWLNAFAEPLSPEGENESQMERREWAVCVRGHESGRQHCCSGQLFRKPKKI